MKSYIVDAFYARFPKYRIVIPFYVLVVLIWRTWLRICIPVRLSVIYLYLPQVHLGPVSCNASFNLYSDFNRARWKPTFWGQFRDHSYFSIVLFSDPLSTFVSFVRLWKWLAYKMNDALKQGLDSVTGDAVFCICLLSTDGQLKNNLNLSKFKMVDLKTRVCDTIQILPYEFKLYIVAGTLPTKPMNVRDFERTYRRAWLYSNRFFDQGAVTRITLVWLTIRNKHDFSELD